MDYMRNDDDADVDEDVNVCVYVDFNDLEYDYNIDPSYSLSN